MEVFATLGDMLLRRYVTDYIGQMQQLSSPVYSRLPVNANFTPSGAGAFFAVRVDGNESGGAWRATDDNTLPSAGNERIKQARVLPKKYYHVVTFSGLAEAVSARGGEDAFAAGITDALTNAVTRAGANMETTFLRSDGTGRITTVSSGATSNVQTLNDARTCRSGMVVVFLNNNTGLRTAGPATILAVDVPNNQITLNISVTTNTNDGMYISGEQSEAGPPVEVTALGLPKLVNNTGTIYNLSRTTYPILQSQVINAASTSLDESMLRRLRKRLMIQTAVESLDGYAMVSNHDQFDRYTEIALPFRRFQDLKLELGAQQELTTFEGRPWLVTWAALPDQVYFLNLAAVERGVIRPLSIDERVNMAWVPGQDAFTVLLKYYGENVGRLLNQTAKIINLTIPTY